MLLTHLVNDVLEEFLQGVVGVFSSLNHFFFQIFAESFFAIFGVAIVEELNGALKLVTAVLVVVNLEFEGWGGQKLMQNDQCIVYELFITYCD